MAGASCASSLPARAEVVTTRLAQTNSRQFGAEVKTANAAAIYWRRPATGLRVRKDWRSFRRPEAARTVPGRSAQAEVQPNEYHQPCGHRISGDLSGFGALASEGRCMTGINRADTASEKFCPTICVGPTSIWGDRSRACMTGLNHQRPTTPTVDAVIVMPSPEFPPSCQAFAPTCLHSKQLTPSTGGCTRNSSAAGTRCSSLPDFYLRFAHSHAATQLSLCQSESCPR